MLNAWRLVPKHLQLLTHELDHGSYCSIPFIQLPKADNTGLLRTCKVFFWNETFRVQRAQFEKRNWEGCHCNFARNHLTSNFIHHYWLQGESLHYRGESVWEAVTNDLLNKGMKKAHKVCIHHQKDCPRCNSPYEYSSFKFFWNKSWLIALLRLITLLILCTGSTRGLLGWGLIFNPPLRQVQGRFTGCQCCEMHEWCWLFRWHVLFNPLSPWVVAAIMLNRYVYSNQCWKLNLEIIYRRQWEVVGSLSSPCTMLVVVQDLVLLVTGQDNNFVLSYDRCWM